MRPRFFAVAVVILTLGASFTPTQASTGSLLGKASAELERLVARGADDIRAIAVGAPHDSISVRDFGSRADIMAELDHRAAPFFDAVEQAVRTAGGQISHRWSIAPAVAFTGSAKVVEQVSALRQVKSLDADRDDAVRLIEPLPDGPSASNTQGRQQLQAEEIWAMGYRGEGIKISIIDTGLDPTHEAFRYADGSSRVIAWKDWVSNRTTPYDDYGHGTHVAGSSLGSAEYNHPTFGLFQEVGVAPKAELLVSKFLDSGGGGSFANAINSLQWSFDNGADITSNSWGASCSSASNSVMAAVRQLTDLGMLSVFAAGNSGPSAGTVGAPACSESALSVGAIDNNKVIAAFSSRGSCRDIELGTPTRICPDVVAKGAGVRSAIPRSAATYTDPTGYKTWQGTSMATPHISGAVALIEQMKRALTGTGWDTAARAEEEVLKLTALDLGTPGEDNTYGWGLPQLTTIAALLNQTDEPNIISSLSISAPLVRQGDSTELAFSVRNLGSATATGPFLATLTAPDGSVTTLRSSTPSLGLLDGESVRQTFTVTGSVVPGDYTLAGSFDYTWTDPDGNTQTGSVALQDTFKVARVFVDMSLSGLDATALPGTLQNVAFVAKNTGNEDAGSMVIEVTVPDSYVFVPGANFSPADPKTRYANPAPTSVVEDRTFSRVTLVFDVGTLTQGSEFKFSSSFLPSKPGNYRVLTVAKFKDGASKSFSQSRAYQQTVGV